jgi:hypothetical protein
MRNSTPRCDHFGAAYVGAFNLLTTLCPCDCGSAPLSFPSRGGWAGGFLSLLKPHFWLSPTHSNRRTHCHRASPRLATTCVATTQRL